MWVCTSTAPGRTYLPEASITWASGADSPAPTAFTTPSSDDADSMVRQLVVPTQITRPPSRLVLLIFSASDSSTM